MPSTILPTSSAAAVVCFLAAGFTNFGQPSGRHSRQLLLFVSWPPISLGAVLRDPAVAAVAVSAVSRRTIAVAVHRRVDFELDSGNFESAADICNWPDSPCAAATGPGVIENRELGESQLEQLVGHLMDRNIFSDLEFRISWVATVIKQLFPSAGAVWHGVGHDGGLRPDRHGREDQDRNDCDGHQYCVDLHGDGPDDGASRHLPIGQPEHSRCARCKTPDLGGRPGPGKHFFKAWRLLPHRGTRSLPQSMASARPRPVPA